MDHLDTQYGGVGAVKPIPLSRAQVVALERAQRVLRAAGAPGAKDFADELKAITAAWRELRVDDD